METTTSTDFSNIKSPEVAKIAHSLIKGRTNLSAKDLLEIMDFSLLRANYGTEKPLIIEEDWRIVFESFSGCIDSMGVNSLELKENLSRMGRLKTLNKVTSFLSRKYGDKEIEGGLENSLEKGIEEYYREGENVNALVHELNDALSVLKGIGAGIWEGYVENASVRTLEENSVDPKLVPDEKRKAAKSLLDIIEYLETSVYSKITEAKRDASFLLLELEKLVPRVIDEPSRKIYQEFYDNALATFLCRVVQLNSLKERLDWEKEFRRTTIEFADEVDRKMPTDALDGFMTSHLILKQSMEEDNALGEKRSKLLVAIFGESIKAEWKDAEIAIEVGQAMENWKDACELNEDSSQGVLDYIGVEKTDSSLLAEIVPLLSSATTADMIYVWLYVRVRLKKDSRWKPFFDGLSGFMISKSPIISLERALAKFDENAARSKRIQYHEYIASRLLKFKEIKADAEQFLANYSVEEGSVREFVKMKKKEKDFAKKLKDKTDAALEKFKPNGYEEVLVLEDLRLIEQQTKKNLFFYYGLSIAIRNTLRKASNFDRSVVGEYIRTGEITQETVFDYAELRKEVEGELSKQIEQFKGFEDIVLGTRSWYSPGVVFPNVLMIIGAILMIIGIAGDGQISYQEFIGGFGILLLAHLYKRGGF